MRKFTSLATLAVVFALTACSSYQKSNRTDIIPKENTFVIAFGSCSHEDDPQPIWNAIVQNQPDLWIWLGDNIYGDTDDMNVLKAKYELQNQNPDYQKLKASTPIIGTWDDHDYGRNNAGKEYEHKKESMQLALDFLGEPKSSPRRKQQGIYAAYEYGNKETRIKVILLDARYNRDKQLRENKKYIANPTGDILGEEQWTWLEKQLQNSKADINIIASGIQIIPEKHPYEKWANFPVARNRLFELIALTKAKGVIFLSGDRHIGEISRKTITGIDYPVYEVTSSGLTHSSINNTDEVNPYRVGALVNQKNFGIMRISLGKNPLQVELLIKGKNSKLYSAESVVY